MSLQGKTVVVTRAAHQAADLGEDLVRRGARVVYFPMLEIGPPLDRTPLERAARHGAYDWIIFVSQNAATQFLAVPGLNLGAAKLAAIGAKTAALLEARGLSVDCVPVRYHSEGMLEALGSVAGLQVLVPQSPEARGVLVDQLRALGAQVDAPEAYRLLRCSATGPLEALHQADIITFASGRTLELFLESVAESRSILQKAVVAVIGPVAADAARRAGVRVDVVPPRATVLDLAAALDML